MWIIEDWIKSLYFGLIDFLFSIISMVGQSFWNNAYIQTVLGGLTMIANTVFLLSFIIMLANLAQEVGSTRAIQWMVVIKNFVRGLFFANFMVAMVTMFHQITHQLVGSLPFVIDGKHPGSIIEQTLSLDGTFIAIQMAAIPVLIGTLAYMYYTIVLYTSLFVHVFGGMLLIPSVVNGDASAIPSWIKGAVTFSLTYYIQCILFHISISMLINFDLTSMDTILALCLFISILIVPKALGKFGHTTGFAGIVKAVGGIGLSHGGAH